MTDTTSKTADMVSAIPNVNLTPGAAVRVFLELQEWTQSELAAASGSA